VQLRRGLPTEAKDLGRLDALAIDRVREEVRPDPRDAEELHDLLLSLVMLRPLARWRGDFHALVQQGRAARVETGVGELWLAAERVPFVAVLHPGARVVPALRLPAGLPHAAPDEDVALAEVLRGHLEIQGPCTATGLSRSTGLDATRVQRGLARLEAEGFVLVGDFDPRRAAGDGPEYCARRLLARVHGYTQARLRREIEPVTAQDFVRFLLRWQRVAPGTQRDGMHGALAAVEQLQGLELAAGAWEEDVLAARVADYRGAWLDSLCLSGAVAWGRLGSAAQRGGATPSRATPLALARRDDLPWLLAAMRGTAPPTAPASKSARAILASLERSGALFSGELAAATDLRPREVEEGLWDLVARGSVTSDGFESLRLLLGGRRAGARAATGGSRRRLRRRLAGAGSAEGRWSLLGPGASVEPDELAMAVAEQLLARWGVVFHDLLARESTLLPWRDLLLALRRLEARGTIRGGRFVTGFSGEQFALPGAVDALRRTRRLPRRGEIVQLSAADPLNLVGILTPGARVPAVSSRRVAYRDGLPIAPDGEATEAPPRAAFR
jgi:ATP-dependent Lhr-like helicase